MLITILNVHVEEYEQVYIQHNYMLYLIMNKTFKHHMFDIISLGIYELYNLSMQCVIYVSEEEKHKCLQLILCDSMNMDQIQEHHSYTNLFTNICPLLYSKNVAFFSQ